MDGARRAERRRGGLEAEIPFIEQWFTRGAYSLIPNEVIWDLETGSSL